MYVIDTGQGRSIPIAKAIVERSRLAETAIRGSASRIGSDLLPKNSLVFN
jgi:hypothetical protein